MVEKQNLFMTEAITLFYLCHGIETMYIWKESMQLGVSEEVFKIMTYPDLLANTAL